MNITHVGIITGGRTSQAHINIHHAESIGDSLQKDFTVTYYDPSKVHDLQKLITDHVDGKLDFVINNSAGKEGGDGTIEGLLSILDIPFLGSDLLATGLAFNKKFTKKIAADLGIPVVKGIEVHVADFHKDPAAVQKQIEERVGYPAVVKASEGSDQIGASLVKKESELVPALKRAFKEDEEVIVESFIRRVAEVTCMVIGNGEEAEALYPADFVYKSEFPYVGEVFEKEVTRCTPDVAEKIQHYSWLAHRALGCADYSRSDFIVDKDNDIYFLETNAHAGLWNGSVTHFITQHAKGWSYDQMIRELMQIAAKRQHNRLPYGEA